MLRRPTGIIILLLALFAVTTVARGLATGEWGFEHVRGRSILPMTGVALILLAIAGDRRWITAITAEGAAIVSGLWGLNYARLLLKWGGDATTVDVVITVVLGLGSIAAAVLFILARPRATTEDWFRGSAIFGAGLWIVGLRHGPGSRAGLGLAALLVSTALLVGMFETVQRAPAIGRSLLEVIDDPELRTIREWDGTIPGIGSASAAAAPDPTTDPSPNSLASTARDGDLDPMGILGRSRGDGSESHDDTDERPESSPNAAGPTEPTTGGVPPRTGIPAPDHRSSPSRPLPTPGAERVGPAPANPVIPAGREDTRVTPSRQRS